MSLGEDARAAPEPAGLRQPGTCRLERGRIGDLERKVVAAAVLGRLREDELVVAVVAGQVAGPADPLPLDHADDLLLKVDRAVEVGDVERYARCD